MAKRGKSTVSILDAVLKSLPRSSSDGKSIADVAAAAWKNTKRRGKPKWWTSQVRSALSRLVRDNKAARPSRAKYTLAHVGTRH